ncbi:hypothetical protein EJQ19_02180 [Paenibacillus whitsoniae]|uniref:Glycosyl hydrolase family 88 n=2 Tax=Paenibacillus whitsoniae TaxID=2496558 RepID=A0A3S0A7F7_9BACL|nr:hypothetical protein EJQ19_02180 [Paenibacillus whitsoniae]
MLTLSYLAEETGREDYLVESVRQFLVHIKYLADRKTGLWYHGWTFEGRHHFAEALWARGNCWYTAGVVDYLDARYLHMGRRAAQAVIAQISEDGTVQQVSYGTGMGATLEAYRAIELCPMTYGQALTILMLTEVRRIA